MGVPTLEKAPGLHEPWLGLWRATLKQLQEQGSWDVSQRPLLDEYVLALRAAKLHREIAEERPFSHSHATDRDFVHPGFTSADREMKRALALADALGLTARSRKALNLSSKESDGDQDPFDRLDEVATLREKRAQAS